MKKSNRVPELERLFVPVEWKMVEGEEDTVEGHASIFNIIDEGDDIVDPGAFTKTLAERIPKNLVKFIDSHIWDCFHTLGSVKSGGEDTQGMFFKAKISKAPSAQDTKIKMLEGHIDRLSFGYDPIIVSWEKRGEKMIRHLKEVKLFEITACPIAMNDMAMITAVKSITPYQDLPLAEKSVKWELEAAGTRVKAWSGDNWSKYRKAFIRYDRQDPENQKSYHLPIADVIDGTLTVIPAAVIKAAEEIYIKSPYSVEETAEIKRHLSRYYAQMELVAPWDMTMKAFILAQVKNLSDEDKQELSEALKPAEPPQVALTGKAIESRGRALNLQLQLGGIKS